MNELLDKDKSKKDRDIEESLRPLTFDDYIGQDKIKKNIEVFVKSAKLRNAVLDHMLFYGPPGLGKTTISGIIAHEMNSKLVVTSGPAIEKPGDLASILLSLDEGDVLFIDEIHRLNKNVEEVLYPAMEDFVIDIIVGKEETARSVRLDLPHFTLIGATTRAGAISAPLRDRFGAINRLELYNSKDLAKILKRDAGLLNLNIDDDASLEIAKRSRGTPRIAIRLLKRLRDFAVVKNPKNIRIDKDVVLFGLEALDIDENGLDSTDLRVLKAIHNNFGDGPVGLETLSAFIGEDSVTIEDVCEPFLMQIGFLAKTPRGRVLTELGKKYIQ